MKFSTIKFLALPLCVSLIINATGLTAFADSKTNAKTTKPLSLSNKTIRVNIGEVFNIKSKGKGAIKVKFLLKNMSKEIIVKSTNENITIEKVSNFNYRIRPLKEGTAKIIITSMANKKLKRTLKVNVVPVVKLTSSNFEEEVLKFEGRVVLDFSTDWCCWCKALEPHLKKAETKFPTYKFCTVDGDAEPELNAIHKIDCYPTLALYENGKLLKIFPGYMDLDELIKWLS